MKLCWDNLENIRYSKRSKKFYCKRKAFEELRCKFCGEIYLGKPESLFCDDKCFILYKNKATINKNIKNTGRADGKSKFFCLNCGIEYFNSKKKSKFCSRRCSISYNMKGNKHPQYGKCGKDSIHFGRKRPPETGKKISEAKKASGYIHSEETRKKISEAKKASGYKDTEETKKRRRDSLKGEKCYNWKGGYSTNNIPMYDTYAPQLEPCELCRRNEIDQNILEVRCIYCGKWYIPTLRSVHKRIGALYKSGGNNLYCSKECKQECPIFGKFKHYKGQEGYNSREVQPELRQLVFERDNWTCQKCGNGKKLHCHHIDPISLNPIESADIDNCITLCKECHKWVHINIRGCGYSELAKTKC